MQFVNNIEYEFEEYMGDLFYRIITEFFKKEIKNVVEFGPGFRYKVAYALNKLNFSGTLYVFDINKNVLNYVRTKYQKLLPKAKIITIQKSLKEGLKDLPKKIDIFLSNHCIDDMVITEYLGNKKSKKYFNNSKESKQLLINLWRKLEKENHRMQIIKNNVLEEWNFFLNNTNIDLFILNHYKSKYYLEENNIVEILTKDIFRKLKKRIKSNPYRLKKIFSYHADFDDSFLPIELKLKNNIQKSQNWIIGSVDYD